MGGGGQTQYSNLNNYSKINSKNSAPRKVSKNPICNFETLADKSTSNKIKDASSLQPQYDKILESKNPNRINSNQDYSSYNIESSLKQPFSHLMPSSLQNTHKNTTFIHADLCDKTALDSIFTSHNIIAVIHFAAFAYVGESVSEPSKYYRNNIANTLNLLESMRAHNVRHIIFSSTCATYGNPLSLPITESHPQNPINPYGYTKLVVENMLQDFARAYSLNYVILRYFNAAGASMLFDLGESHEPETHLIPLLLQTALGQRACLSVFGDDYESRDGSCVRDYIHIDDLASAHILALKHLLNGGGSEVFNLSNGEGFSVFELIKCAEKLCGKKIPYRVEKRRAGDPATLIGDSTKAREILGWKPHFYDIETILKSALRWHTNPRY